jgi:hypothetical protein
MKSRPSRKILSKRQGIDNFSMMPHDFPTTSPILSLN